MLVDDGLRSHIETLIERGNLLFGRNMVEPAGGDPLDRQEAAGWMPSALQVLYRLFPDPNSPYRTQAELVSKGGYMLLRVGHMASILRAVLSDIDAGVVGSIVQAAQNEVFDDFLEHSEHYLRAGRLFESAVIAGVVFEDTIRRACEKNGIAQKGVELEQLIVALSKAGHLTKPSASRARVAATVRTMATHAQRDELDRPAVEDCVRFTRELIDRLLDA